MLKRSLATLGLGLVLAAPIAGPAAADDIEREKAEGSVSEVMDRLEAAVTEAGATVFARVDHGGGANSVGMELGESELLIFGNPKLGTPAIQADPLAGLFLPLKMLVYADAEGQTWIAYEEPDELFDDLKIDDDAEWFKAMEDALEKFKDAAD